MSTAIRPGCSQGKVPMPRPVSQPIFGLDRNSGPAVQRAVVRRVAPYLERLLGLEPLQGVYERAAEAVPPQDSDPEDAALAAKTFVDAALDDLGVDINCSETEWLRIPEEGPFVVVANHPFGALEGLLLAKLLLARRPDVRILANYMLERIPELSDLFLLVDPWARDSSRARNARALKEMLRHLRGGGLLAVFPAGEVAHRSFSDGGELRDARWQTSVGKLIQRSGAPVLPVYFCGENSLGFQLAGMVHPLLRTALLPRELLNKNGRRIRVRIGQPIRTGKYKDMEAGAFTAFLQERTEILKYRSAGATAVTRPVTPQPIAEPISPQVVEREIERLSKDRCLVTHEHRRVFMAPAAEAPAILMELGRLRQVAFREVGEGTEESRDLDRFDYHYQHLFVWDDNDREIVGAYRIGLVDQIVKDHGKDGLYSGTLFDIDDEFFERVGAALELGRSFVQPRYQRDPTSLFLLWKGIGAFVARYPQYCHLFGPCSVSNDYEPMSRRMIVRYLDREHGQPELSQYVHPRLPLRRAPQVDAALPRFDRFLTNIGDLSNWVTHLEADQKRVPVLVRQYLRLGGKMLGFNVDPAFGSVVDCFVLVNLLDSPVRVLSAFMGAEQTQAFRERAVAFREGKLASSNYPAARLPGSNESSDNDRPPVM